MTNSANTPRNRLSDLENGTFSGNQTFQSGVTINGSLSGTGTGIVQVKRQSADVEKTESTTLSDLTGLVHTVVAGATYRYRAHVQCLATANGGTKLGFKLTGTTLTSLQNTSLTATATANAAARTTTATDEASLVAATSANLQVILEGTFVVNAGGNIQLRGAQNASHADTTTYYAGSTFEIVRIA